MKRHIRKRFLFGMVLFLTLLASGYLLIRIQIDPEAVRAKATASLSKFLGADVTIASASFDPFLGIRISDLKISLKDSQGREKVLARMPRVRLVHRPTQLLAGKFSIREVYIRDAEVYIERSSDGRLSVEPVIEALGRYLPDKEGYPAVEFDRVHAHYTDYVLADEDGQPTSTELRNVLGSIRPVAPHTRAFRADVAVTETEFGRWTARDATFDTRTGTLTFTAKSSPIVLDEKLKKRMNGKMRHIWDRFSPRSGTVRLTANFRYDRRAEKPVDFDVLARFEGAAASYESFPYELTDLDGTLVFRPEGVEVQDLRGRSGSAPVRFSGGVRGYGPDSPVDIRIEAKRLPLDAKLRAAFDASRRQLWDELRPEGLVDIVSRLDRDTGHEEGGTPNAANRVSGPLRVRVLATNSPSTRVRATYSRFPYPLDLEGWAFYDRGAVTIVEKPVSAENLENLTPGAVVARHKDVAMELEGGTQHAEPNRLVTLTFRLRPGSRLPLDEDLKQALPAPMREAWDYLDPAGSTSATCRVERIDPEEPALDVAVVLTELKTRIRCRDFPYEIRDPEGSVLYERTAGRFPRGRLLVRDLRSVSENTTVEIAGEISGFRASAPVEKMDLTIRGTSVALDRELRRATPAKYASLWEYLSPTEDSLVNVECRLERTHSAQQRADFSLKIDSIDSSLMCADFPYRVEHLQGLAEYRATEQFPDGVLRLADLRCSGKNCGIGLTGVLSGFAPDKSIDRVHLVIDGQMVPLDAKLRSALPQKYQKTFDAFHPEGHVDVTCTLKRASRDEKLSAELSITPLGSSMCYERFPLRLRDISGSITIANGEVSVCRMRSRAAQGIVTLDGVVHQNGGTPNAKDGVWGPRRGLDFAVKAQDVTLGPELEAALPPSARELWRKLAPSGVVTLSGTVRSPSALSGSTGSGPKGTESGSDGRLVEYSGVVLPQNVSLQLGLRFEELTGAVKLEGSVSGGKHDFRGRAEFATASVSGNRFRELRGSFEKHDDLFSVYEFGGRAYGGDVTGQLRVKLDEPITYGVVADVRSLRLGELLRHAFDIGDQQEPPNATDRTPDAKSRVWGPRVWGSLEGLLSGSVCLQGRGTDTASLVGRADLKVHEGRLWKVPFVLRLLKVLDLSLPERTSFSEAELALRFYDRRIDVTRAALVGKGTSIYGEGVVEPGGGVKFRFATTFGLLKLPELPLITPVVRSIQKQIILVKMTGNLKDPKVEVLPIAPVTGTMKDLVDTLLTSRKPPKEAK